MEGTGRDRWSRIETIFAQATALAPDSRGSFLDETCASDPVLREEVERLLDAHEAAGDFLESIDPAKSAALLRSTAEPETVPTAVGRHRIVRRLGGGAMGVVYLAHDPELDRPVALKLLRPEFAARVGDRRLLEEARAASALDHPNVAVIHEVGQTEDGRAFIAMAYCEGESLAQRLKRGPLDQRVAVDIGRQVADALAAAHSLGVVHRDVKPGNIMISAGGRARLTDFGIASVAGRPAPWDDAVAGTPAYMSPDQLAGGEPDASWDVWALGVLLHEMLTGRRPPAASGDDSFPSGPTGSRSARDRRGKVPAGVAPLIERCRSAVPADRPAAAEVAAELRSFADRGSLAPRLRRAVRSPWRWAALVAAAAAIVLAVTATMRGAAPTGNDALADSALAVLPFVPAAPDSALERLGRELVVTLSANLDGVGGLRSVPPTTVLSHVRQTADLLQDLPPVLGAGWRLSGQLTRAAGHVRVDAAVHAPGESAPVARATATAQEGDITALTDSITIELLSTAWPGVAGPAPNLAAITTRSVPALRAYLEGELAIAAASFRPAASAFARAIEADSTFWFAWWRYLYARSYHGDPVDSVVVATVIERRSEFPEPDRLLVEARMQAGERATLARRRTVTSRNSTYWPAWFELGDQLVHHAPFLGIPLDETQAALRRVMELNPHFMPAIEHFFWGAILQRDTAGSGQALARLEALRVDTLAGQRNDLQTLAFYGYLDRLARTGGEPSAEFGEIGATVLSQYTGSNSHEGLAMSVADYGFFRAQLDLGRRVLERQPAARIAAAQVWAAALSWAGRGAWDSAFVAARRFARMGSHERAQAHALALVTAGVVLGQIDADSVREIRQAAARADNAASPAGSAELHWLDGLVACTRGDSVGLRAHRDALQASGAPGAPALARSLSAFDLALTGRSAEAARELLSLERENADRAWHYPNGPDHPFAVGVNRVAAARLLLATGDTVAAAELLRMHGVNLPQKLHPMPSATMILGTLGLRDLAAIERARGRPAVADRHLAIFRERADLAGPDGVRLDPTCLGIAD